MLRPGGALLGFFSGGGPDDRRYTKYVIEDDWRLRLRGYAAACHRERVLHNREITNLFGGLELFGSVLLKSGVREVLFCKARRDLNGAAPAFSERRDSAQSGVEQSTPTPCLYDCPDMP